MWHVAGSMAEGTQHELRILIDRWADAVAAQLDQAGLRRHDSPLFRPFSILVVRDAEKVLVGLAKPSGTPSQWWIDEPGQRFAPDAAREFLEEQQGLEVTVITQLPHSTKQIDDRVIDVSAAMHIESLLEGRKLQSLGDLAGVEHLKPHLETFLVDHPRYERNVFVMMRFANTPQHDEIYQTVRDALAARGMTAVRADDRDYTGELWSNIEVYLRGCKYGVAVFDIIEQQDFNPNVALELGYMMGRGKRTLLLKDRRLPALPADVVHRLYREFDSYAIRESVQREVDRWINDLGL
ncbi:hypothetical protein BJF86_11940 [Serinicoccus sp. CNJ-927]|nr:hypothetical protein BJF86_11940 [Serinicoccus sp. CNJ-927]